MEEKLRLLDPFTEEYKVSADLGTEQMYQKIDKEMDSPTLFDRWKTQQPQCRFGQEGICCHICGMGPCRINPKKSERGICGATAETIVSRNLLRHVTAGAAAYIHHAKRAATTLKETSEGKTGFSIKDEQKLREMLRCLGLQESSSPMEMAKSLADFFFEEINKPVEEPSAFVTAFAPRKRLQVWEELNIIPGGAHSEVLESITRTMSHINTDPMELLLNATRLSISSAYTGLLAAVMFQDILLGTPKVTSVQTNLGVIDPAAVNILVHGHQPLLVWKILEHSQDEDLLCRAADAGAKDIKVYGSTDVGQELIGRGNGSARLAGQIGSWMKQEFAIATGAVDMMVVDFNCTIPGLKAMAERFHTKLLSVEPVVRLEGVDTMAFDPSKADEQARAIVEMAIEAFTNRKPDRINIPEHTSKPIVGFTTEAVLDVLGGSLSPLIDAIVAGKILGIAAVVGCTNPHRGRHEMSPLVLAEELVARDILVVSSGCCASDIQHSDIMTPEGYHYCGDGLKDVCYSLGIPPVLSFGSCTEIHRIVEVVTALSHTLNVDTSQLPVAVSAPEWMDEKSLADGLFSVALGLFTHVSPALPVTGSKFLSRFLSHRESKRRHMRNESTIVDILGGEFAIETDPVRAASLIEYHIAKKREKFL